jgi:hypothetical protein
MAGGVLVGLRCGRELRSTIPTGPSLRYRLAHFAAVRGAHHEHLRNGGTDPSLLEDQGQPQTSTGVSWALAWYTKALGCEAVP